MHSITHCPYSTHRFTAISGRLSYSPGLFFDSIAIFMKNVSHDIAFLYGPLGAIPNPKLTFKYNTYYFYLIVFLLHLFCYLTPSHIYHS